MLQFGNGPRLHQGALAPQQFIRDRFPTDAPPLQMRLMTAERRAGVELAGDLPSYAGSRRRVRVEACNSLDCYGPAQARNHFGKRRSVEITMGTCR